MRTTILVSILILGLAAGIPSSAQDGDGRTRGRARAEESRPKHFPHRIWAACDFETRRFAWFGPVAKSNIPSYPGNATVLSAEPGPYKKWAARMTGMNPVPGPRMGMVNSMYCRYFLKGGAQATFQHFSLSSNDNNHIRVSNLTEGKWSELTLNFSRDGRRNDGTRGVPFKKGERMDDLKVFVGKPADGLGWEILLDDIIFYSNDPSLPPEPEPFPNRVMFVAAFDTGINPKVRDKWWHGAFDIVWKNTPEDTWWGCAKAIPRKQG